MDGLVDAVPLIWCSRKLIDDCKVGVEAGIISRDVIVGIGRNPRFTQHKHAWDEIFCFLVTNPTLGANSLFHSAILHRLGIVFNLLDILLGLLHYILRRPLGLFFFLLLRL